MIYIYYKTLQIRKKAEIENSPPDPLTRNGEL